MLLSQSKTFILLQPPVPHAPLFLQPALDVSSPVPFVPHPPVEQDLQAMICLCNRQFFNDECLILALPVGN